MRNFCSKTIFLEKNSASSYPWTKCCEIPETADWRQTAHIIHTFSAISFTKTPIYRHHYEHFETAGHLKMAWRWSVVNKFPKKTLKKQQNRTIKSKIKIVPPFWIISHCYVKSREVGDRQWMSNKCGKFEYMYGRFRPGWRDVVWPVSAGLNARGLSPQT
jgi:hypothetical protein